MSCSKSIKVLIMTYTTLIAWKVCYILSVAGILHWCCQCHLNCCYYQCSKLWCWHFWNANIFSSHTSSINIVSFKNMSDYSKLVLSSWIQISLTISNVCRWHISLDVTESNCCLSYKCKENFLSTSGNFYFCLPKASQWPSLKICDCDFIFYFYSCL